jgi:predicted ATPase
MLKRLRLERFKNFKEVELILGPLTLLVGTNASGKSNIRDAFRFLHGISRGYILADIMGEKYIEGGVLQWLGIRGGTREVAFQNANTFAIEVSFPIKHLNHEQTLSYRIEVNPGQAIAPPRVVSEYLVAETEGPIFTTVLSLKKQGESLSVKMHNPAGEGVINAFPNHQPLLSQLAAIRSNTIGSRSTAFFVKEISEIALATLAGMRFLELSPEAMRLPSFPGQTILGDRGENLSSVIQSICNDPHRRHALIQWVKELTPMDAKDFKFPSDFTGRILLTLLEENGQTVSAYSTSDGTLRFLAIIAALLGPEPAQFYFFEELENGIHPTRLHLLLQLIERKVSEGNIQIVTTTHSPQLLRLVSQETLEYASLTYRLPDRSDARIQRILDIPDARRIVEEKDPALLLESGWLDNAMYFLENEELGE